MATEEEKLCRCLYPPITHREAGMIDLTIENNRPEAWRRKDSGGEAQLRSALTIPVDCLLNGGGRGGQHWRQECDLIPSFWPFQCPSIERWLNSGREHGVPYDFWANLGAGSSNLRGPVWPGERSQSLFSSNLSSPAIPSSPGRYGRRMV